MTSPVRAETPRPLESIYLGRGADVDPLRPVFTGDVFQEEDHGPVTIVLQHPCALRSGGIELVERVLVADVLPAAQLPLSGGKFRSDWHEENLRLMALPDLFEDGEPWGVDFRLLQTKPGSELQQGAGRRAALSLQGVNLLQQRWIRHNSRVLIPTATFAEQIAGPFEEAELAAEWTFQSEQQSAAAALSGFDTWLSGLLHEGSPMKRRRALEDPQLRPAVRRAMLQELRNRTPA